MRDGDRGGREGGSDPFTKEAARGFLKSEVDQEFELVGT